MPEYIFAHLNAQDLEDITALEQMLGARHGRSMVLVAYTVQGGTAEESLEEELASLQDWSLTAQGAKEESALVGVPN